MVGANVLPLRAVLLLWFAPAVSGRLWLGDRPLSLLQLTQAVGPAPRSHPWPTKNGDLNHTGHSSVVAPFKLGAPSWEYRVPVALHTSPVIDDEGNVYLAHSKGIVSLDKHGHERWVNQPDSPGVPALLGNDLFTCSRSGTARAVDLKTGATRWERKVARSCPGEGWVASAVGTTFLLPANVDHGDLGNCDVLALSTVDGQILWRYKLCDNGFQDGINAMMSIVEGTVILQDTAGSVHRLDLATGAPLWVAAGHAGSVSTGGMLTGPNGAIYAASNSQGSCDKGKGMLRALDLRTGTERWHRDFASGLNAAPAIGRLRPGGPLVVVVCEGDNFMEGGVGHAVEMMLAGREAPVHRGTVHAINAETAESIWSYEVAPYQNWIYPQMLSGCLPDAFGSPAIGGDGTVYISWSGGRGYALKDANGDGRITEDEVSSVETNSGMNAETAISPSLMVLPSCDRILGYAV